jgi:hypothetical protein
MFAILPQTARNPGTCTLMMISSKNSIALFSRQRRLRIKDCST